MNNEQVTVGDPEKIDCPHCGTKNCFEQPTNDGSKSYLCAHCGFMSSTHFLEDSERGAEMLTTLPSIVRALTFIDPATKQLWFPTVINIPGIGMLYPEGPDTFNWYWSVAKIVPIKEEEREKFPVPDQPGQYYDAWLDVDHAEHFDKFDFLGAMKSLGVAKDQE